MTPLVHIPLRAILIKNKYFSRDGRDCKYKPSLFFYSKILFFPLFPILSSSLSKESNKKTLLCWRDLTCSYVVAHPARNISSAKFFLDNKKNVPGKNRGAKRTFDTCRCFQYTRPCERSFFFDPNRKLTTR